MIRWTVRPMMQQPRLWLTGALLVSTFSCGGPEVGPSPGPGSIVISTMTQGPGSDGDGFTVALDKVVRAPIGMMGAVQLDSIEAGTHTVGLGGNDSELQCRIFGKSPVCGRDRRRHCCNLLRGLVYPRLRDHRGYNPDNWPLTRPRRVYCGHSSMEFLLHRRDRSTELQLYLARIPPGQPIRPRWELQGRGGELPRRDRRKRHHDGSFV